MKPQYSQEVHFYNGDPTAGKAAILLGVAGEVIGAATIGIGLAGLVNSQIGIINNEEYQKTIEFIQNNGMDILKGGGIAFAAGFITEKVGRIKHWYQNKNFYC